MVGPTDTELGLLIGGTSHQRCPHLGQAHPARQGSRGHLQVRCALEGAPGRGLLGWMDGHDDD